MYSVYREKVKYNDRYIDISISIYICYMLCVYYIELILLTILN